MDCTGRTNRYAPTRLIPVFALALLAAVPATRVAAQDSETGTFPLLDAVTGEYHRAIVTDSDLAQSYFDQGMQMVYAFTLPVAIRSFEEAQRQDPSCALCAWGEAKARGPFLNGGLTDANAGPAFAAAQRALDLIENTDDPKERALIRAMALRYTPEHDRDTRAALDSAYSRAMSEIYAEYPDDADIGTLYAESLMLLNPRRGSYESSDPFVQQVHSVLEQALHVDITHPGACHTYIHATEATVDAFKAEPCADILMTSVPGSSHLNHMPSHTYNVIGKWGKAVRSNAMAWRSDEATAWGEGVSYGATHNLHMLFFAGSMDGQRQVSLAAAEAYVEQVNGGQFYQALVMHRFGDFRRVLELTEAPERPLRQGLWEFARGYAHLKLGAPDSAAVYLAKVDEKAETMPDGASERNSPGKDLMAIAGDILRGEMARMAGDFDGAIASFLRATEVHDGLPYAEPEALNFHSRHWLGAALIEAGRFAEAEEVYRGALEKHPNNGWSYFGLEQALRGQGRTADADQAKADFERVWARADIIIQSSVY